MGRRLVSPGSRRRVGCGRVARGSVHGYGYGPYYGGYGYGFGGYGYRPYYGYGYRPHYGYGYRPYYRYRVSSLRVWLWSILPLIRDYRVAHWTHRKRFGFREAENSVNKTAIAILGSVSAVALAGDAQASTTPPIPQPSSRSRRAPSRNCWTRMPNAAAVLEAYSPGGVQVYPHGGGGWLPGSYEQPVCIRERELGGANRAQGNCARYREMCGGAGGYNHPSSLARG